MTVKSFPQDQSSKHSIKTSAFLFGRVLCLQVRETAKRWNIYQKHKQVYFFTVHFFHYLHKRILNIICKFCACDSLKDKIMRQSKLFPEFPSYWEKKLEHLKDVFTGSKLKQNKLTGLNEITEIHFGHPQGAWPFSVKSRKTRELISYTFTSTEANLAQPAHSRHSRESITMNELLEDHWQNPSQLQLTVFYE